MIPLKRGSRQSDRTCRLKNEDKNVSSKLNISLIPEMKLKFIDNSVKKGVAGKIGEILPAEV